MDTTILHMHGIRKSFGGVQALLHADFSLRRGEVMALVGENGAGKSTLMRIMTGIYTHDGGEIEYKGRAVSFQNARESSAMGIQIIHQEFNLFPNLSAAENIFLDNPATNRNGLVDWGEARKKAAALVASIGGDFDVNAKVSSLSVQNQQMVEIAKALASEASILIMDEPTSALPDNEVQNLFATIRRLKAQGVAIVYVSHRLNEIFEICDTITVLRDGVTVMVEKAANMDKETVISQMVGRDIGKLYPRTNTEPGEPVLEVKNLSCGVVKDVSFTVRAGEILGLYGLVGSGATECPEVVFGLHPEAKGTVSVQGKPLARLTAPEAIKRGIAYVPADRHREGAVQRLSIRVNTTLAIIRRISGRFFVRRIEEEGIVKEYIERLRVRCSSPEQALTFLSGGNQQKVVLAKWLSTRPHVLLLNDPTRGVDVGAKAEIYGIISELASAGMGVVITSSDIEEVLGMADRILVFNHGVTADEVTRENAGRQSLLAAANAQGGGSL